MSSDQGRAEPVESRSVPWEPYTLVSLRAISLCEETGQRAEEGLCPVHGGDACLYTYRHPYDNAIDRWKKAKEWGLT